MISDEGFSKIEHLLRPKDFNKVYEKGQCVKKDRVFLYILPNTVGNNRIGFSIGSRYVKLATRRNKIRRLFREAYRHNKKNFKPSHDIVIVIKKNFEQGLTLKEIETLLLSLARTSRLLMV